MINMDDSASHIENNFQNMQKLTYEKMVKKAIINCDNIATKVPGYATGSFIRKYLEANYKIIHSKVQTNKFRKLIQKGRIIAHPTLKGHFTHVEIDLSLFEPYPTSEKGSKEEIYEEEEEELSCSHEEYVEEYFPTQTQLKTILSSKIDSYPHTRSQGYAKDIFHSKRLELNKEQEQIERFKAACILTHTPCDPL